MYSAYAMNTPQRQDFLGSTIVHLVHTVQESVFGSVRKVKVKWDAKFTVSRRGLRQEWVIRVPGSACGWGKIQVVLKEQWIWHKPFVSWRWKWTEELKGVSGIERKGGCRTWYTYVKVSLCDQLLSTMDMWQQEYKNPTYECFEKEEQVTEGINGIWRRGDVEEVTPV